MFFSRLSHHQASSPVPRGTQDEHRIHVFIGQKSKTEMIPPLPNFEAGKACNLPSAEEWGKKAKISESGPDTMPRASESVGMEMAGSDGAQDGVSGDLTKI
jgi:hypothetical protein